MAGAHRVKQSQGAKGKDSKETKGATTFCQTHSHLPSFRTSLPEAGDNSYCLVHRCIHRLVMICAFQGREPKNGSRRKINFTKIKWKTFYYTNWKRDGLLPSSFRVKLFQIFPHYLCPEIGSSRKKPFPARNGRLHYGLIEQVNGRNTEILQ